MKFDFLNIVLTFYYVSLASSENFCGDWESFNDEKCFKVYNEEKYVIYDEGVKLCTEMDNGSSILTIHSKEEQDFISNYLFETKKIVDNIWLGLKNNNNVFEWNDKLTLEFTNWGNGNPTNKKCVEIQEESVPKGKWVDVECTKKLLVVCQKHPARTMSYLQETLAHTKDLLMETRKELTNTTLRLNSYLNQTFNQNWLRLNSFTDSDGKHKAFIFPLNENIASVTWINANNTCAKYNGRLIEIYTSQKQQIVELVLGQLGQSAEKYYKFWINGKKDSSGKYKWLSSGKDFVYTNFGYSSITTFSYSTQSPYDDYITIYAAQNSNFGYWSSASNTYYSHIICEVDINI